MNAIIDRIATALETIKSSRGIVQIYKGDPVYIPNVNMPCVTINPVSTSPVLIDSCHDAKMQTLSVVLILDAMSYFNAEDSKTALLEGARIMEEEDENFVLKTDTILSVIRKTIYDDPLYSVKTENESISYEFNYREFPTVEISLTFSILRVPYLRA